MNNVGDIKTFTVSGGASDGSITYVWTWWDSTVTTTTLNSVQKLLNIGGVNLPVVCEYCDQFGNHSTLTTSVTVNSPPVLTGAPVISVNDALFPFTTTLSSTAYDPEAAGLLSFLWYNGNVQAGAGSTSVVTAGTWRNSYTAVATAGTTLTQLIIDVGDGTTRIDYSLRGYAASGLTGGGSSSNNSIIPSTNNLPEVIIGPGQTVTFTTYAYDPSAGQLQFAWSLLAAEGWASNYSVTHTPAQLTNGSYRDQITVSVAPPQQPGFLTAHCTVTNLTTGQSVLINNTVQLNAQQPPAILSISTDALSARGFYLVKQNSFFHLTGTATDPNNLLLSYRWDFTTPNGVTLWGRQVMMRPDQFTDFNESTLQANGPQPVQGQLTVTDHLGATATTSIQSFVTVQVWPY